MKKIIAMSVLGMSLLAGNAQTRWVNPAKADFYAVQNQGWAEELAGSYKRLPPRAEKTVRKALWDLSRNSAGLAVRFKTDSPEITVRYSVEGPLSMPHMPATGVSGVDMYRLSSEGKPEFCFGSYSFGDTIRYSYTNLGSTLKPGQEVEYELNLPLFNTVKFLEIGTPQGASFILQPRRTEKPVVVYGTSIAHGACSSRPGMAWANIVRRNLDMPLVNLGFSGNGRLEPELVDLVNELDAAVYVLDCMPNLTQKTEQEVTVLVLDAVAKIRAKSNTPILLVEHAGYSNAPTNAAQYELYTRLNRGQRVAFDKLMNEGTPNLFYLTHDQLGFSPDSWVDYVHPSDLGAQKQADAVTAKLKEILNR